MIKSSYLSDICVPKLSERARYWYLADVLFGQLGHARRFQGVGCIGRVEPMRDLVTLARRRKATLTASISS